MSESVPSIEVHCTTGCPLKAHPRDHDRCPVKRLVPSNEVSDAKIIRTFFVAKLVGALKEAAPEESCLKESFQYLSKNSLFPPNSPCTAVH